MFENIVLALVGFGLGILTTVITQMFLWQLRHKDARRAHQLKQLQLIREWMEAERSLFHIKYPYLSEFVFCHRALVSNAQLYDKRTPEILYVAMKQYLDAREKVEYAARKGNTALLSLASQWFYKIPFLGANALERRDLGLEYPRGFPRKLQPYLSRLGNAKYKVFDEFPNEVTRWIGWDKFPFIDPSEIKTIIEPRLNYFGTPPIPNQSEEEARLGGLRENLSGLRFDAENAIDSVLEIVEEYEKKWL